MGSVLSSNFQLQKATYLRAHLSASFHTTLHQGAYSFTEQSPLTYCQDVRHSSSPYGAHKAHDAPSSHTISQRLRKLRQIPAELIPLGVVVAFAVFAAGYSSFRKFFVDKNLRLTRQNRKAEPVEHH
ncbi:hypothetical protein ANO14919_051900 [Xylariales sp. No.14919]|nr:hypothetical protein ANO14919_051900 [Xylariales sp. No.14919]